MARKILAIERSPLARNVYSMILAKLDEIEICSNECEEIERRVLDKISNFDLIVASHSTIKNRTREFKDLIKEVSVPCVVIVQKSSESGWNDLDKVKTVERPFFPDDFLKAVKDLWSNR